MQQSRIIPLCLLLMTLAASAAAQPPITREYALEIMEEGRWAQAEGLMQADGSFLAKEIDVVAAEDSANMERLKITGPITELDRRRSSMSVIGYRVTWDADTKIKDENKRRILSSKLDNGTRVKIKGDLHSDGTFRASSISIKPASIREDGTMKVKHELYGPVEVIDPTTGLLRMLNRDVRLTPDCTFKESPVEMVDAEQP